MPNHLKNNKEHYNRIERYAAMIQRIFDTYNNEAIKMAESVAYDASKMFKFSDYPELSNKIKKFQKNIFKEIHTVIVNGITAEWGESNLNNNKLVEKILGNKIGDNTKKYFNNNESALNSFLNRKDKGMDLSDKVWNLSNQYKDGLEDALSVGMSDGRSAAELSRDIRGYLNEPKKLFRRVRGMEDKLRLSSNAKSYNPGAGVYRSSYKNALRLTRTEINMAYRSADHERWNNFDFVVGQEIKLSGKHKVTDICDTFAGKYPKDFKFVGWHPWCTCFVIPILKTDDEFFSDSQSVNEVKEVPAAFNKWAKENSEKILKAKSLPYFIRDNSKTVPQLYISANRKYAGIVDNKVQKIAKELNVLVTPINLKDEIRILEKANNDYMGDLLEVKDIVRTTLIGKENEIQMILDRINKDFKVYRYKEQNFVESGYTGHLFNIKTSNGTFAEIQVNTPQMIYGKSEKAQSIIGDNLFNEIKGKSGLEHGLGHKYYEQARSLDKEFDTKLINELNKKQREYYQKLRSVRL